MNMGDLFVIVKVICMLSLSLCPSMNVGIWLIVYSEKWMENLQKDDQS